MATVERSVFGVHFNLSVDHLDVTDDHCVNFSGHVECARQTLKRTTVESLDPST